METGCKLNGTEGVIFKQQLTCFAWNHERQKMNKIKRNNLTFHSMFVDLLSRVFLNISFLWRSWWVRVSENMGFLFRTLRTNDVFKSSFLCWSLWTVDNFSILANCIRSFWERYVILKPWFARQHYTWQYIHTLPTLHIKSLQNRT